MNIEGTWYNELGSMLTVRVSGSMLAGTYQSGVGAEGVFQMTGMIDPVQTGGQSFGMVVTWNNGETDAQSTTAWSGQLQVINGQETLTTMWLLNEATEPVYNWESMLVGQDVFTRTMPETEKIQAAIAKHPYKR